MKNILKAACVLVGVSFGTVAMAASGLPTVKIIWNTSMPSSPVSLGIYTGMPNCVTKTQPVTRTGSFLSQNLNNIPACAGATSMQALILFKNGAYIACFHNNSAYPSNIPFNNAQNITVNVTNFTPISPGGSATCSVQYS